MAAKYADRSRERHNRVFESLGKSQTIESGELQMRRSIEELPKLNETNFSRNVLKPAASSLSLHPREEGKSQESLKDSLERQ
jgi:hypothetical protein